MTRTGTYQQRYGRVILLLSVLIPVVVGTLFRVKIEGVDSRFLPGVYATINAITAVLLVLSLVAIKKKRVMLHQRLNTTCIMLSVVFLVLYVVYHMTTPETRFGGEGAMRYFYFFILTSHILLSMIIVPLVLFTWVRGMDHDLVRHKKIARYTWPLWFYEAVSGVLVYWMLSPYYEL